MHYAAYRLFLFLAGVGGELLEYKQETPPRDCVCCSQKHLLSLPRRKAAQKPYRQRLPTYHALHIDTAYPHVKLQSNNTCQGSNAAPAVHFLCFSQLFRCSNHLTPTAAGTRKDFTSAVSRPPVYGEHETPSVFRKRLYHTTKHRENPTGHTRCTAR